MEDRLGIQPATREEIKKSNDEIEALILALAALEVRVEALETAGQ